MEPQREPRSVSEDELDALLAEEAGLEVAELRGRASVDLTVPWESEIVAEHTSSPDE